MFHFLKSSLGKKYIMALSGLALMGFAVAHLLGNLQMFIGAEAVNSYAQKLHDLGPLLWVARIGLLVFFAAHLITAFQLKKGNKSARPVGYKNMATVQASTASRLMIASGALIFFYIIYHLLHFTLHIFDPSFNTLIDAQGRKDVYAMVVQGFSNPCVALAYMAAMVALGLHLFHGSASVFQSLGLSCQKMRTNLERAGAAIAILLSLGYISIPVGVWMGIIQ